MKIVDEIRGDHRLIDEIAGSLHTWARRGADHPAAENDRMDFVRFLRKFLIESHHRCEEVLFKALVEHGEIPGDCGPLVVLRGDHEAVARAVSRLENSAADAVADVARGLADELWQHMDKEESVLLPEARRRLIDGGVRELDPPPVADDVEKARELGFDLVRRLPPVEESDLIRGDGCIPCPAFAETCHGIETEWWSDWERAHFAGLDEG